MSLGPCLRVAFLVLACALFEATRAADAGSVIVGEEKLVLPTYSLARTEPAPPLFPRYDGGLYPYASFDRTTLSDRPVAKTYRAIVLENEYLRVTLVPELGGRIWRATEKATGQPVFYENHVVKPTGRNPRGAWPAGGFEVYGPYDTHTLTYPGEPWADAVLLGRDGSVAVVLSHVDHLFRNKLLVTFRLYPRRAYIEVTLSLHNPNSTRSRYLLWTNAAAPATSGTRFLYPMTRGLPLGMSQGSPWPVADGIDLSWYRNHQQRLALAALDLADDYIGSYDAENDRGLVRYANRFVARGAKIWTWGAGAAAGQQLAAYTDADGPYAELHSGRFAGHGQYEFLEPGTADGWTEYWYPVRGIGGFVTANLKGALNVVEKPGAATVGVFPTREWKQATVRLLRQGREVARAEADLSPKTPWRRDFVVASLTGSDAPLDAVEVTDAQGALLLRWTMAPPEELSAEASPRKFGSLESLSADEAYRKGVAEVKSGDPESAAASFLAALRRDPRFAPALLERGLLAFGQAQWEDAERKFRAAVERAPDWGEARYYLGLVKLERGQIAVARRHLYQVLPGSQKYARAQFELGRAELLQGRLARAARFFRRALEVNGGDRSAREALAYALRRLDRSRDAANELAALDDLDPTSAFVAAEKMFARTAPTADVDQRVVRHPQGYLELAAAYLRLGAWEEAAEIASRGLSGSGSRHPLLFYYRAYAQAQQAASAGEVPTEISRDLAEGGASEPALDIWPFRLEEVAILKHATRVNPGDSAASYLLGTLLWGLGRKPEALSAWRQSCAGERPSFLAFRALGLAEVELGDQEAGLRALARAVELAPDDISTGLVLGRVYAQQGRTRQAKSLLEHMPQDDDRVVEQRAALLAQQGRWADAAGLLRSHPFRPQRLSRSLLDLYREVHLGLGAEAERRGERELAAERFTAAGEPPARLAAGELGEPLSARLLAFQQRWELAASVEAASPEQRFFRALALARLSRTQQAEALLESVRKDAQSFQGTRLRERRAQGYYLRGLLARHEGRLADARQAFGRALVMDASLLSARVELARLP